MKNITESIRFFAHYFKRYWVAMIAIVVFTIFATWAQVKAPVYMGRSITELSKYLMVKLNPMTASQASLADFHHALWTFAAFVLLMLVGLFINAMIQSIVASNSVNQMRKGLFGKMQRMTVRYFDSHQDGEVLSRFTSDLDNIFNAMNQAIFQLFSQVAMLVGVVWMMFNESPKMAWVTIASTPGCGYLGSIDYCASKEVCGCATS